MRCTTASARRRPRSSVHPLPAAWGDPTAVEQIFANLLGNAVQYLDPARPGRIEVGSAPLAGDELSDRRVYYVKDNGLGIPEAYHDRVFTAFNRLHATWLRAKGSGWPWCGGWSSGTEERSGSNRHAGVGTTFFVALPASARSKAAQIVLERSALRHKRRREERLSAWHQNRS